MTKVNQFVRTRKLPTSNCGEPNLNSEEEGTILEFFDIRLDWMQQDRELHNNMVDYLIEVAEELKVAPDKIMEEIKKQLSPNVLREREE